MKAFLFAAFLLMLLGPETALQAAEPAREGLVTGWEDALVKNATSPVPVFLAALPQGSDPVFLGDRLFSRPTLSYAGLARTEKPGWPVFDPGSNAVYASANGLLVRVDDDGALMVQAANVQGLDVDVRKAAGLFVSREDGRRIVLRRLGDDKDAGVVVAEGEGFFEPRFSPDGSRMVICESRGTGGWLWLAATPDWRAMPLCRGDGPAWSGDGRHLVFSIVENTAHEISAADLWAVDFATGAREQLTDTDRVAETSPVFSPDGRWLLFFDAIGQELLAMPWKKEAGHAEE